MILCNELGCRFEDLIGKADSIPIAQVLTPIGASTPQCGLALRTGLRGVLHKAGQMLGCGLKAAFQNLTPGPSPKMERGASARMVVFLQALLKFFIFLLPFECILLAFLILVFLALTSPTKYLPLQPII